MSSYEYHQILQFLYFEGYADSYEEAEELVESLSDDEFEELNEARRKLAHSFPLKPSERRSADNIERMNRGDFSVPPGGSVRVRSSRKNEPKPEEKKPRGRTIKRGELLDIIKNQFDLVADYLFSEGYADSLDGAEVMAESISDNWIQSILSESDIEPPKERLVTDRNMFNISQEERNAARERTLAKAKAAREKKKNR
jgi:hypothetical protein